MFLRIDGSMVHTIDLGDGHPAVLGLAGVFGNMEIWQLPFELLHRRFRTVAFDHYGTGETYVDAGRVTFDHQVDLVSRVLQELEVDRCVLAGDSSLTSVAVAAAHRWPDRFAGLVLVAGRLDHQPVERTTRFVTGLRSSFDRTLEGFVEFCLPEDTEGHLRRWLFDIIARTGPERSAALVESFYEVEYRSLLGSIGIPTLVIHGDMDYVNPLDEAREIAAAIPDAELLVLEQTGHVPTISRPAEVASAIEDFIDRRL